MIPAPGPCPVVPKTAIEAKKCLRLALLSALCQTYIPHTALAWYGTSLAAHSLTFFFSFFFLFFSFSELCWGKAMVAYTMPQQRKKKERSERLRGERDQIELIDLEFVVVSSVL